MTKEIKIILSLCTMWILGMFIGTFTTLQSPIPSWQEWVLSAVSVLVIIIFYRSLSKGN